MKQLDGGRAVLCQNVERHLGGIVAQGKEHPLVLRHSVCADKLCLGNGHLHVAGIVDAQREVVRAGSLVEDGARIVPVQPEVDGEVTLQEHGVHRPRHVEEGNNLVGYVVVHLTAVQFGGDDDVVRVDIARHDVLVELDGQLVAVAQDAVGGRRRVEVARTRHVLGDGDDVAIYLDILRAIGRGGEGTELVVALREREVALHLRGIAQVALLGQQGVAHSVSSGS